MQPIWRTVDPAIPRQVAPLQSLRLFHRARLKMSCKAPAGFRAHDPATVEECLQCVSEALIIDAQAFSQGGARLRRSRCREHGDDLVREVVYRGCFAVLAACPHP